MVELRSLLYANDTLVFYHEIYSVECIKAAVFRKYKMKDLGTAMSCIGIGIEKSSK